MQIRLKHVGHLRGNWLKFFFKGVIESSQSALELAEKIMTLMRSNAEKLQTHYGRGKSDSPLDLLMHLFSKPIVSGEDVISTLGRAKSYCYGLIGVFEELGILVEYTGIQELKAMLVL